jgi:hypothetical protein
LPDAALEPDLIRFIEQHLPSVEHLEVLLLLGSSPDHWWTVRAVNDLLRSSEESIRARLGELTRHRLIDKSAPEETFRFTEDPQLAELVSRLRNAYKDWRVRVIESIYKTKDPASEFSRAFDFRKKNHG